MSELLAPVRPTVDDVAALLRARTKTSGGDEAGTFNGETRPTGIEVQRLIALAEGDVLAQVGTELSERFAREAGSMIALRAACFVELSYWPEQVRSDRSAYHELWRMYEAGMAGLLSGIEGSGGGEGGATDAFTFGMIPVTSWTQTRPSVPVLEEVEELGYTPAQLLAAANGGVESTFEELHRKRLVE